MTLTKSFIRNAAMTPLDARLAMMTLVTCDEGGNPRAGVLGDDNAFIVGTTSGMNVSISAAEFVTTKGKSDGVAVFTNNGTVNVAIPAAPGSNSRIDVIWVKHEDNTTGDAASLPIFGVTSGAAAASPVKPAIPTGALELATLQIFAGTVATNGGANVLTNTFPMTAARGAPIPFRTRADMDAETDLLIGQLATVIVASGASYSKGLWIWDGSDWGPVGGVEMQEAYTWNRANVDGSPQYPELVADGTNTTDSSLTSFQRVSGSDPDGVAGVKFPTPGIYHIMVGMTLAAPATARSFIQIGADTDSFRQRSTVSSGEDQMSVNTIVRTTAVDQVVPIWFYKSNGNLGANTGRVRVVRLV
jgi:hypothetical protein